MIIRTRGITLVELLLALGLLTGIILATTSWIQITAATSTHIIKPLRWQQSATAVLQLIHDDLMTGEFPIDESLPINIELRANTLSVIKNSTTNKYEGSSKRRNTRVQKVAYQLDAWSHQLSRIVQKQDTTNERLILTSVGEMECEVDEELGILTVSLLSSGGDEVQREYRLP